MGAVSYCLKVEYVIKAQLRAYDSENRGRIEQKLHHLTLFLLMN